jgi:hypothetical protein
VGLDYFNARYYDAYLNRWIQPDPIIPDPNNPQSYDRYEYCWNNPVRNNGPTGHWPDWLDYGLGATTQFLNDMSFGLFYTTGGDPSNIQSDAFQSGRQAGRDASIVVSSTETVVGAAVAGSSLAAMGPTAGGGLICGAATGGTCLVVAGAGLTAEGAGVLTGTALALQGGATYSYIKSNPINGSDDLPQTLQTGGRTLKDSTLKALGLTKDQGKSAIEALKEDFGWRNDIHGKIMSNGDLIDPKTGNVLGNLYDYVP